MLSQGAGVPSLYCWIVFLYICTTVFYPFTCRWIFRLFRVMAIVNNTAVNLAMQIMSSTVTLSPLDINPEDLMFHKLILVLYGCKWYFNYCHDMISYLTFLHFFPKCSCLPFKNIFLYLIFYFKYYKNNVLKCLFLGTDVVKIHSSSFFMLSLFSCQNFSKD